MSSTSACKCGTSSLGSRMLTNPLIPGPDRISSMLIGSRTCLGRDFFFGFVSRLDMQELHQLGAGNPVIVRRLAVRVHVHQEFARTLGFGNRSVGPDGR